MAMKEEEIIIEQCNSTVSITCGGVEDCDKKSFKHNLAETVGDLATRFLTEGFRVFCTQIELNGFFNLKSTEPSKPAQSHHKHSSSSSSSSSSCTRESTHSYTETYVKRFSKDNDSKE